MIFRKYLIVRSNQIWLQYDRSIEYKKYVLSPKYKVGKNTSGGSVPPDLRIINISYWNNKYRERQLSICKEVDNHLI
jgi:hypothetical protein